MSEAVRHDVLAALRARLDAPEPDHPDFVGPPLEGLPLTPLELGELESELWRTSYLDDSPQRRRIADEIRRACRAAGVEPRYTAAAAERALATRSAVYPKNAMAILAAYDGEPTPALRARAIELLSDSCHDVQALAHRGDPAPLPLAPYNGPGLHVLELPALALARLAGEPWLGDMLALVRERRPRARWLSAEREALTRVSLSALAQLAGGLDGFQGGRDEQQQDVAVLLADEPAYQAHARVCLEQAAAALDDLHAGRIPYVADGLFELYDTPTLSRAARVAAMRDEPWFRTLVGPLLTRAVVAPTAAKTAPSQSLSIALGYVIEGYPTPEGVQALKDALAVVRHAGLEKKLGRNLRPAQRGVAARPEVALRLLPGAKADKKQQAFVAVCLEATLWRRGSWPLADWLSRIAATPNGAPFAFAQVWRVEGDAGEAREVRAVADKSAVARFVDVAGRPVEVSPDARIGLWHPLLATPDERTAWQRAFVELRLRQPVRQVFREIYEVPEGAGDLGLSQEFAGHHLRLQPLIGLARREGWVLGECALSRRFGDITALFGVGADLYPGMVGSAPSDDLRFLRWADRRWQRLTLAEVDPIVYSEACRAVDLLVSVSAFAVEDASERLPLTVGDLGVRLVADTSAPPAPTRPAHAGVARFWRVRTLAGLDVGAMATMRRRALELALGAHVQAGRVAIEARHVRVGDATVHLATGRVVDNGVALELEPPAAKARLAAVPWLPYDEVLLQRIADNVAALLARP